MLVFLLLLFMASFAGSISAWHFLKLPGDMTFLICIGCAIAIANIMESILKNKVDDDQARQ